MTNRNLINAIYRQLFRYLEIRLARLLLSVTPAVLLVTAALCGWPTETSAADPADANPKFAAEDLDFFEKKIRPVLVEHCYQCHSAQAATGNQLKGGLVVDSREGLLAGGDSGPAVVPGNVEESLLLDALRYESFQMPPKGKLPAAVVADFQRWIERGAADPRRATAPLVKKSGIDIEAGRKFWCYQPVSRPTIPNPAIPNAAVKNSIDSFVFEKLHEAGGGFSPEADRGSLARRLYFDLTGLPPDPEEMAEFLADQSVDAYERLVDRLLASPRYGERWGRHWLDVARFAESLTLRGFVLPEAWRYREYIIEAFNTDRPFDQMIREQLAGDLLPHTSTDDQRRKLVATTYLVLGNTNLEEQDKQQLRMDVVDEQIETLGKGLFAQTIGCARCHDHKFDPIPTRDYYALAGIFRSVKTLEHSNVSKWLEFRLPAEPGDEKTFAAHDAAVAALQNRIKALKDQAKASAAASNEKPTRYYEAIISPKELPGIVIDDSQAKVVGDWAPSTFTKRYIGQGYLHDQNKGKGEKTISFVPELPSAGTYEVRIAYVGGVNRASNVPVTIFSADGEKTIQVNQKAAPNIEGRFSSLGQFRFEQNGQGFVMVSNEGTNGIVSVDAVQFLPVDMPGGKEKPAVNAVAKTDTPNSDEAKVRDQTIKDLEKELKQLNESGPKRPMYMSVQEEKKIDDTNIHIRGSVHNLGEKVPRGFLQVATYGNAPTISAHESGRRELAEWASSRDNPLTARVMANRIWHWLLGVGIVRTTDNFGTTGELPSHPQLLDHLASRFHDSDWSIKEVVREIVMSHTYRQSSAQGNKPLSSDPENRLLWRANRRRHDAECLLDAVLMASGELRLDARGKTIKSGVNADYNYNHDQLFRAVYWPSLRNSIPELLEVFDAADPSVVTGRRNTSTVSPQALFLMNDDWILARSQAAANRLLKDASGNNETLVKEAYRRTLSREPSANELKLAIAFLVEKSSDDSSTAEETKRNQNSKLKNKTTNVLEQRLSMLFQAIFASIDFRYIQ